VINLVKLFQAGTKFDHIISGGFGQFKFLENVLAETVPILLTPINNFGIIESIKIRSLKI